MPDWITFSTGGGKDEDFRLDLLRYIAIQIDKNTLVVWQLCRTFLIWALPIVAALFTIYFADHSQHGRSTYQLVFGIFTSFMILQGLFLASCLVQTMGLKKLRAKLDVAAYGTTSRLRWRDYFFGLLATLFARPAANYESHLGERFLYFMEGLLKRLKKLIDRIRRR